MVNGETNYTDRVLRVQPAGQTLKAWLVNTDGRRFLEHTAANAEALVTALRRDLNNAFIIKRLTLLDNPSAVQGEGVGDGCPSAWKARRSSSSSRPTVTAT